MYSYNPDRRGLSEVKILKLEPHRLYPKKDCLKPEFLATANSGSVSISRDSTIVSIGSCFAREIKNWLVANDYNYIQKATGPCTEAGSARYDRVYNTFSILQEFERAFGDFSPVEDHWHFFEQEQERFLDPYRKNVAWESEAEMLSELKEHKQHVSEAFSEADVLILTVGQAEIWYNKKDDYVYPLVPPQEIYDSSLHGFRYSTYEENLNNLNKIAELFHLNNPTGKIIITLSPVPLRATFKNENSVLANTTSKSMLRTAIETFVQRNTGLVSYFPSYELVTALIDDPFKEDARHVRPEAVQAIMQVFEKWYVNN